MKRKSHSIMYNKMYLITPMVYEKLKNCLNKSDISNLTLLNKPFFVPTPQTSGPTYPPYPPYPFGKLDETSKKLSEEEEKEENPPRFPFKFEQTDSNPPGEEQDIYGFEHPKTEMWEEQYLPTYEEPESQMSFDEGPINWSENIQEYVATPTQKVETGVQTADPLLQQSEVGIQTDEPVLYSSAVATQTDTPPQQFSQATQTFETPKTFSSQKTQTSSVKKSKSKKKKQSDDATLTYNIPPPPPPPPPPASTSMIQFLPSTVESEEKYDHKPKIKAKKPPKSLSLERQMRLPLRQRMRNIPRIDYQPRLARHIEHFGLPVTSSRSTQIVPLNPQQESRALVRYVPQNRQPQIAGISSAIPRFNIDEEYITPIPQPELVYRQPPGVTFENRPEIEFNQPPAIAYREPLRLEYKPSPPPRPLKTYSQPVKRKIQSDDSADVDAPATKTLVIRKPKKDLNIDLPKTYQKTNLKPPSYESFDGKMRLKVKPPQYLKVIDETIEDETAEPNPQPTPKFLCDMCGLTLSSAYNLARHKEREIKRQNRESDRERQYKLWFNDGRGAQTKRTSTDAKFVPRQDKKRTAKEEFERWNE
ncbi:hypothetical protein [Aeromonas sobria]|uniref:hypothetical protein n=1 Tax=Aeromonas sobria TaxID=646 RepID=UPI003F3222FA